MEYREVAHISRDKAETIFNMNDECSIRETLLSITIHEPDWHWIQTQCLKFVGSSDKGTQTLAITCLGHLARIHRTIELNVVMPILMSLYEDADLRGTVEDTLSDIEIFVTT